MSSQARTREEERRLNVRTLAIASVAAAAAAIVTSRFWTAGTPIAAALTPVIVAIVSEALHRPTEKIARRLTSESPALRDPERPPVTIYRPERRRLEPSKLPWLKIGLTALAGFAIGAVLLTVPELIAGQSLGKGDRATSVFGGSAKQDQTDEAPTERTPTVTETVPAQPTPAPEPAPTTTQGQPPATTAPATPTTPTTPAP